jgi:cytochrome oxidase Cu insertion factor (SCO1/SenC/PrrC family)
MTRKQKNIFNFLSLFFLLIVLPVGALYFLERGIDYRKELLAELDDYGKMPGFSLTNLDGSLVDNNRLKKRVVVVNFFDVLEKDGNVEKGKVLTKLVQQFEKREDILFLNFVSNEGGDSLRSKALQDYINTFKLDNKQSLFVKEDPATMRRMAKESMNFPFESSQDIRENNLVALADTSNTIRRHYDLLNVEESKLLVKHIIMLLPEVETREGDYEFDDK